MHVPQRSVRGILRTKLVASATVRTLPSSWYCDPVVFEAERRSIFRDSWLLVGFAHQVVERGDYVAEDLAGWPVLVRRGADGELRGALNVCPHRAGPLVEEGTGRCGNLVCRYHGWAFDDDGALRAARDFGGEVPADSALTSIDVEVWRGLVWVRLSTGGPSLPEWLGAFAVACTPYPMESFVVHRRTDHHVVANWKTYADNYLEGYHIPLVHPGLNRAIDARRYEVTVDASGRFHRHDAPSRDGSATTGAWLYLWPNTALNLYPDGMSVERFLPRGHDRVEIVFDYLFTGTDADAEKTSVASSEAIMEEDRIICEAVQRRLASGAYDSGLLSPRHEAGVAAFQRLVREALEPS